MKINILAVGTKMSNWIDAGCNEYLKRFPKSWELQIKEIVQKQHHSKHSVESIKIMESDVIDVGRQAGLPQTVFLVLMERLEHE